MKKISFFWKKRSIVFKVIVFAFITTAIAMGFAGFLVEKELSDTNIETQRKNCLTSLDKDVDNLVNFIDNYKVLLRTYANVPEISALRGDEKNPSKVQKAQKFTEAYAKNCGNIEGIYYSDAKAKVIAHNSPKAVGLVTRDEKTLPPLLQAMDEIKEGEDIAVTGIRESPAQPGVLVCSMFYPIRNEKKNIIGWCSLAAPIDILSERFKMSHTEEKEYDLFNRTDGTVVISDKEDNLNKEYSEFSDIDNILKDECFLPDDKSFIRVVKEIENGKFVLIEKYSTSVSHDDANRITGLVIRIMMICLLISFVVLVFLRKFFNKDSVLVQSVADSVKNLDLSSNGDDILETYSGAKSEAGKLANTLKDLKKIA